MNGQYNVGDVVLHNWTLTRLIGAGSYGKVYEAKRSDFGGEYSAAVKIIVIPQTKEEINEALSEGMTEESISEYFRTFAEEISKEFGLMSKLKGDSNIVSYEDHEVSAHDDGIGWDIIIRMELLTPFSDILKTEQLKKEDIVRLGIDICRALELCQQEKIIHRDIKPDNIFRSRTGSYKLGDFGVARTLDKTTGVLSKKGTYNYMAPEVYKEEPYDATVDIYSLGIVLYRLLNNNRVPFLPAYPQAIRHADREAALARRMSGESIPPPANDHGRLAEIAVKACAFDPKARYSTPLEMREDLEALLAEAEEAEEQKEEVTIYDGAKVYKGSGTGSDGSGSTEPSSSSDSGNSDGSLKNTEDQPPEKRATEITPEKGKTKHRKLIAGILAFVLLLACGLGTYKIISGRQQPDLPVSIQTEKPAIDGTPATQIPIITPNTPTPHVHVWADATCTEPKGCTICGAEEGGPLGHAEVVDAAVEPTCTESGLTAGSHCDVCGEILSPQKIIDPLGHDWAEATCTEPSACKRCGEIRGKAAGHSWSVATCTEPKTCTVCGATEGKPLGHDWKEATFSTPSVCARCRETRGEPLPPTPSPAPTLKPAPVITSISLNSDGKPVIMWDAIDGVDYYTIYRSEEGASYINLNVNTKNTAYTVNSCKEGHTYFFKIKVKYMDGTSSDFSNEVTITLPGSSPQKSTPTPGLDAIQIETAINNQKYESVYSRGTYYLYEAKDYDNAREYLEQAAEAGHSGALAALGEMYYYGYGLAKDYLKALELYQKSADLGDPQGMQNLADYYYLGDATEPDYQKAFKLYSEASGYKGRPWNKDGYPWSYYHLGELYRDGKGVDQNFEKAAECFTEAARKGIPYAMYELANLYYAGNGLKQDISAALEWYQKAADQGVEEASRILQSIEEVSSVSAPSPDSVLMAELDMEAIRNEIIRLMNEHRSAYGLPVLTYDYGLQPVADIRAEEISIMFSNVRPNGSDWSTAYPENVFYFKGENRFSKDGYLTEKEFASACVQKWMETETERANILGPYYMVTAVGVEKSGDTLFAVQEFSTPR